MRIAHRIISPPALACFAIFAAGLPVLAGPPAVWTQHNDNSRTGSNTAETILAPSNVDQTHFGKIISYTLDDQTFSQPLYIPGLTMPSDGQKHNVVYVATVNNSVYAFDADGHGATPLWLKNLTPSGQRPPTAQDESNLGACGGSYNDFAGNMGIVGTPVIDTSTNTMYLVARWVDTATATQFVQTLHALDITTGNEKFGGPVTISATASDGAKFDPAINNQRTALSLVNGVVYIGWASHCDNGNYHGWLLGYRASDLTQVAKWNATDKNSWAAGIWQSGQGVTVDSPSSGTPNLYLITGNGTFDGVTNFGESFVKLGTSSTGAVTVSDYFTPSNVDTLNAWDADLGSSGPLGIPGTNLIVGGGKMGLVYLVNTGNMGHESTNDNVVQEFQATFPTNGATGHIHGSLVFLNSTAADGTQVDYVYLWGENDFLHAYKFTPGPTASSGSFNTTSAADSAMRVPQTGTGMPGGFLSLSSNNGANGVIWALTPYDGDANQDTRPGILYAFDASNFSGTGATKRLVELWDSRQNSARDSVDNYAKFTYPTIANGKVYVSGWGGSHSGTGQLLIYGEISNPTPVITSLSPTGAVAGGNAYTLTVNGSNFAPTSTVNWDGTALVTTFVSSTQLTAAVPATNIASAGNHAITVVTPAPGGGTSNSSTEEVDTPCTLTSISPASAQSGSSALTLTVNGSGFMSTATVYWTGSPLSTTFVSSSKLTASIPASNLTTAGRFTITASNAAAGSGSGSATFTVTGVTTFLGLIKRSVDGAPLAAITVTLTDASNNQYAATSLSSATTGVDHADANFSIANLPGGTYTLAVTAPHGITLPALSASVTIPNTGSLRQDVSVSPAHTFQAGLQLMSVPDDYGAAAPTDLLAGLGTTKLATWDAAAFTYALSSTAPADRLRLGRAYWARPKGTMSLYGASTPIDQTSPFLIALSPGWNMIADPFETPVKISDFRAGTVASPSPAGILISQVLYGYDPTSNAYVRATSTLDPYAGYWVYALHAGNLIIYPAH